MMVSSLGRKCQSFLKASKTPLFYSSSCRTIATSRSVSSELSDKSTARSEPLAVFSDGQNLSQHHQASTGRRGTSGKKSHIRKVARGSYAERSPLEAIDNDWAIEEYKLVDKGDLPTKLHVRAIPRFERQYNWHSISSQWLRDQCTCDECVNIDTAQRKVNVFDKTANCEISSIEEVGGGESLLVTFADGHKTNVITSNLTNRNSLKRTANRYGMGPIRRWKASGIADRPPTVSYSRLRQSDDGLREVLLNIRSYGFCFVNSMPPTPEATEDLLKRIGPIRNTHYGGFYDFTSDLSSKDTAYTAEALEPHTDTTYFTDSIGLQALHLLSHTDGQGGLSSLVDGFSCASSLFRVNPTSYKHLSDIKVSGHASGNEGISILPADAKPTLVHHPVTGHLMQVRWNNADRAGIDLSLAEVGRWYKAAQDWHDLISDQERQYWFQLKPGEMLLFDNWRLLHGRSAFTGKRRMCGGYINRDDWVSKLKNLTLTREELRASTVTT